MFDFTPNIIWFYYLTNIYDIPHINTGLGNSFNTGYSGSISTIYSIALKFVPNSYNTTPWVSNTLKEITGLGYYWNYTDSHNGGTRWQASVGKFANNTYSWYNSNFYDNPNITGSAEG